MRRWPPGDDQRNIGEDEVLVAITRYELIAIANAINETFESLDDWEYDTRVGMLPVEARLLQRQLHGLLREVEPPQ